MLVSRTEIVLFLATACAASSAGRLRRADALDGSSAFASRLSRARKYKLAPSKTTRERAAESGIRRAPRLPLTGNQS